MHLFGFEILSYVVLFLIRVKAGDLRRIFTTKTSLTGGIRHIDTDDGNKAFSTLLNIFTILLFLFLFSNLLIGGLAILEPQEI